MKNSFLLNGNLTIEELQGQNACKRLALTFNTFEHVSKTQPSTTAKMFISKLVEVNRLTQMEGHANYPRFSPSREPSRQPDMNSVYGHPVSSD